MVDRQRVFQLVTLVLVFYLFITASLENPHSGNFQNRAYRTQLAQNHNVQFEGTWKQDQIGILTSESGRSMFFAEFPPDSIPAIVIHDGLWNSDPGYVIEFANITMLDKDTNLTLQELSSQNTTVALNDLELKGATPIPCRVSGEIQLNTSARTINGKMHSKECNLNISMEMQKLSGPELTQDGYLYCFLVSIIYITLLYAFFSHVKDCFASESYARKTSIAMLFMNCVIDFVFCIFHFNMMFLFPDWSDYMMLWTFWNFSVFIIVESRLVLIVWKAQNEDALGQYIRQNINSFHSRFFALVFVISVALLLAFDAVYAFTPILMCYFVPQILKNAREANRRGLKPSFYATVGICRTLIVLYYTAYPGNYLIFEPRYSYSAILVTILIGQLSILYAQSTRPRFFVPRCLWGDTYSYFRVPKEDQFQTHAECVIWMTPLNIPQNSDLEITNFTETMFTPCEHGFHESCLVKWMNIKMKCPTCRQPLPLLEE